MRCASELGLLRHSATIGGSSSRSRLLDDVEANRDHFDGRRFFNPTRQTSTTHSRRSPNAARVANAVAGVAPATAQRPPPLEDAAAASHSSGIDVSDSDAGRQSANRPDLRLACESAEAFGPRRVRPAGGALDDLPPISAVFLSHNHYDHCDLRTLRARATFDPLVVTPLGNGGCWRRRRQSVGGTRLVAGCAGVDCRSH